MKKSLRAGWLRSKPALAWICAGITLLITAYGLTPDAVRARQTADSLTNSFVHPPAAAKPQVWWHWVNGNVSKPGITADLEAMKKVGIGGGTICNLGDFAPEGPAHFNSDLWWSDLKFAMSEAGRLGLELGVENCEGWSSSGGPWIKPEDAMKMLVWSEASVTGGAQGALRLAKPPARHDFYRDVAVVAFPSIATEAGPSLADIAPKLTASGKSVDTSFLFHGDGARSVTIPPGTGDSAGLSIDCGAPFTAASLRFSPWGTLCGGQNGDVLVR